MTVGSVSVTPGTGADIAVDDVSGVEYQITKPAFGSTGAAQLVDSSHGLPVAVIGTVAVTDNSGTLSIDDGGSTISIDDGAGSLTVDGTVAVSGVTGTVTVGGLAAIDAVVSGNPTIVGSRASRATPSAVSADGDVQALWVDRAGVVFTRPTPVTVATSTGDVTAGVLTLAASEKSIATANTKRVGLTLEHGGTGTVYVKYGTGALSTSYNFTLTANANYMEIPFCYQGAVSCYGGSGSMYVTEFEAG